MDDNSSSKLDDILQAIRESRNFELNTNDIDKLKASLAGLDKRVNQAQTGMAGYFKTLVTGKQQIESFDYELSEITKAIKDLSEDMNEVRGPKVAELELRKQEIVALKEQVQRINAATDGAHELGKGFASLAVGSIKTSANFVKGIQSNESVFGQMNTLATGAIAATNTGVQGLATGATGVGTVLSTSTNPRLKLLGIAAGTAGTALGIVGNAAATTGQFMADFLIKEMEKTVTTFQQSSAAGAMMSDGLMGIRTASEASGLTIRQFGEVISKNSESLAASGLGVGDAARKIGSVGKILRDTGMDVTLLKLGYGYEEQAELQATTLANMRRTAGGMVADKDVAAQTTKYAESLRIIAGITGEDAKAKIKQVQQQNQILRFQQELAKMTPDQRAQIDAATAVMTDMEARAFRSRVMYQGAVIDQGAAAYEGMYAGAVEKGKALYESYKQNQLTVDAANQIGIQWNQTIKRSVLSGEAIATAGERGYALAQDVSKGGLDMINMANKVTVESVSGINRSLEGQKTTTDRATEGYIAAARGAQLMANRLESIVNNEFANFSVLTGRVFSSIEESISKFKAGMGEQTLTDKFKDLGLAAIGAITAFSAVKEMISSFMGAGAAGAGAGAAGAAGAGAGKFAKIGSVAAKGAIAAAGGYLIDAAAGASGAGKNVTVDEKANELNWQKASFGEKLQSSPARMLETIGSLLFLDNIVKEAKAARITEETAYISQKYGTPTASASVMAQNPAQQIINTASATAEENAATMAAVKTTNNNIDRSIAELKTAIEQLAKTDPDQKVTATKMLETLENMRDTSKAQLDKNDQMLKTLQEQKDLSERIVQNTYN